MNELVEIPLCLTTISHEDILRIDLGLEGDWSNTVVTVWSRRQGLVGFSHAIASHPNYKPSLEFYCRDSWLGIHCCVRKNGMYILDEIYAARLIEYVVSKSNKKRSNPAR